MRAPASAPAPRARCSVRAARRTALSRATAILAALFMVTSLALAYIGTRNARPAPTSVLDTAVEQRDRRASRAGTGAGAAPAPAPCARLPAPAAGA